MTKYNFADVQAGFLADFPPQGLDRRFAQF